MTDEIRSAEAPDRFRLANESLRWRCDPESLGFASTDEVEPLRGIIGQERAIDALRFGLETEAPGQNVFVRGITGTGRMSLLTHLLEELKSCRRPGPDRLYVHDFRAPGRPRLISLPPGSGEAFKTAIEALIEYLRTDLPALVNAESVMRKRRAIEAAAQKETATITEPFDRKLQENEMALATVQAGAGRDALIVPVIDGRPVSPDEVPELIEKGVLSEEDLAAFETKVAGFSADFDAVRARVMEVQGRLRAEIRELYVGELRAALRAETARTRALFRDDAVTEFLDELVEDAVQRQMTEGMNPGDDYEHYRVNLLTSREGDPCPIVVENHPSHRNLIGGFDRPFPQGDGSGLDEHLTIRGGSLLRADGGYLVLDARDLLVEPGAWRALVRTLRSGMLQIGPPEGPFQLSVPAIQPEPVPIRVKVVLVGDPHVYYLLDAQDPDFPQLFKVLADFDTSLPNEPSARRDYARVVARIAADEKLPSFAASGVAALVEHGARIAARQDRLTARFGRLSDLVRESAFLANETGEKQVDADDVRRAIARTRARAELPARRFREHIADGTIRIRTSGSVVGSINGLAVTQAGPLTYGFPARITATIGPGNAGAINIERESMLSGAIHTKGFYILGGLLRHLLRTDHPLAFSASVAFEQSYGGIDGDSASGAEACCLLSALTNVPLRQDLAMTGAIDQHGQIQAVGAVTEKIEGFFDTCRDAGLSGTQGAILPRSNVRDLMLRREVVEACEEGRFHVYAVESVLEALEILTGLDAGRQEADGSYQPGTLMAHAVERAHDFWRMAAAATQGSPRPPGEDAL